MPYPRSCLRIGAFCSDSRQIVSKLNSFSFNSGISWPPTYSRVTRAGCSRKVPDTLRNVTRMSRMLPHRRGRHTPVPQPCVHRGETRTEINSVGVSRVPATGPWDVVSGLAFDRAGSTFYPRE